MTIEELTDKGNNLLYETLLPSGSRYESLYELINFEGKDNPKVVEYIDAMKELLVGKHVSYNFTKNRLVKGIIKDIVYTGGSSQGYEWKAKLEKTSDGRAHSISVDKLMLVLIDPEGRYIDNPQNITIE